MPVFMIDEANELNALKSHPYGHAAIHNLFKWLIMNIKELNKFHVILSSSDSFFHLWVSNYVGAIVSILSYSATLKELVLIMNLIEGKNLY